MSEAEIGDIVTWTDAVGRAHIGRVAAAIVAAPESDCEVERLRLWVVRPKAIGCHGQDPRSGRPVIEAGLTGSRRPRLDRAPSAANMVT